MEIISFQFMGLLLLLAIILVLYAMVIKPYITYKKYTKILPQLGYKTLIHPFKPFGSTVQSILSKNRIQDGDTAKLFKQVYPSFDIALSNFFNEPLLQLVDVELIKDFYKSSNELNYVKADVITGSFKMLVGNGILMKQGDQWKLRKKIISSVFTHDFITQLIPEIYQIFENGLDQMEKRCKMSTNTEDNTDTDKYELDITDMFQKIFSEVIARLFFGCDALSIKVEGKNIYEIFNGLTDMMMDQMKSVTYFIFGQIAASRKFKEKIKQFKILGKQLIEKRLKEIQSMTQNQKPQRPKDIIQALVFSKQFAKDHNKQEQKLNINDLIDEFSTFFIAGMDTTSNLMTSLMFHLCKKSEQPIVNNLRKEIEKVFQEAQNPKYLTYKDLKKLQYTELVQKQALRVYAPINGFFYRKSTKDQFIKDIPIPKGLTIVARNRANHYNEKFFSEPLKFKPERFENQKDKIHPYAFVPFSAGYRTCIGNHLSLVESKMMVALLFKRYKKFTLQKENFKMTNRFLYAPERLKMTLQK